MRFSKLFMGLILCILLTAACSSTNPSKNMGELYSLALDAFMPIEEGLNSNMKFIAIDMSNLKSINEKDKKLILEYFNKYHVEIKEATFEQLKDCGVYDPNTKVLNGILLSIEKTEISKNQIVIEGTKFRGGDGSIGILVTIEFINGIWQITNAYTTWIT